MSENFALVCLRAQAVCDCVCYGWKLHLCVCAAGLCQCVVEEVAFAWVPWRTNTEGDYTNPQLRGDWPHPGHC